eukprot:2108383-Prymnesium_polylepis.1
MSLTCPWWAMRDSALMAGQKRHHDAVWGRAGRTVGDRHPRLWCRRGTRPLFAAFCPIVRAE